MTATRRALALVFALTLLLGVVGSADAAGKGSSHKQEPTGIISTNNGGWN